MPGAAFFDLDRTILLGASGPAFAAALRAEGLLPGGPFPGEDLLYRVYDVVGETLPSMFLARRAADASKGKEAAAAQRAAERAADALEARVAPYARGVLAEHHAAGRQVVLATSSPYDLVSPLAARLGFDDVLATRYGRDDEGRYDGTLAGPFVWGFGKLAEVRRWCGERGVGLGDSYAYSDSVYDLPMLGAVGHPVAVNPDPRLLAAAALRRWPIRWFDAPPGVPKPWGVEPADLLRLAMRQEFVRLARFEIGGVERIPRHGPAIVVANHRSYFDAVALGVLLAQTGRNGRFLGKAEVFDVPLVGHVARMLGGIRVERASGSNAPLADAAEALAAGELVVILPQGTIPRGPAFFDPELHGRWGAAELAALTRVPVIPVGLWGTERVWPRSARIPNLLGALNPPQVSIQVGEAVSLVYRSPEADTRRIMEAIVAQLPPAAHERRTPSPEELARTYPPGYRGDPDAELDRRPGTD